MCRWECAKVTRAAVLQCLTNDAFGDGNDRDIVSRSTYRT